MFKFDVYFRNIEVINYFNSKTSIKWVAGYCIIHAKA